MASALDTACSIGCVMKPCIRLGSAPGKLVVTMITVFSSSGYCRTVRSKKARAPSSRISRLTTVASTGRRMKISVKRIGLLPRHFARVLQALLVGEDHLGAVMQLQLPADHDQVAVIDTLQHRDLSVESRAQGYEGL